MPKSVDRRMFDRESRDAEWAARQGRIGGDFAGHEDALAKHGFKRTDGSAFKRRHPDGSHHLQVVLMRGGPSRDGVSWSAEKVTKSGATPHARGGSATGLYATLDNWKRSGTKAESCGRMGTMMTAADRITAKLTESRLRLVKAHGDGSHVAKVYADRDYNEFRVKHFKDGVHQAAADYHTTDAEDAHATAQHWVQARGNRARMGEAAFDKDPGSAKPPGWYHPAAAPERPQPRTPAPRDLKGVRSAKPRDYHPTPKVAPTHPPASAPRTIKDVRGAKPKGWHHPDVKAESVDASHTQHKFHLLLKSKGYQHLDTKQEAGAVKHTYGHLHTPGSRVVVTVPRGNDDKATMRYHTDHGVTESANMRCTSCGTPSKDYGLRAPVDGAHQPVCIGCHDANFRGKKLTAAGPAVMNKAGAKSFGGAMANAARERGGHMVGDGVMSVPKGSVRESVTMDNALLNARRIWPTATHVEPHSSGGFLVAHATPQPFRTYMDRNGREMTQEDAEGPQRRTRYEPRKVRGRVMSRPVREAADDEGWDHNPWTGHAIRKVSHNIRVVREWEPREGSPGSYVGEYWGDHSLKFPVRAGRKQSYEDAVSAARRLEKKHGPHPERKA